MEKSRTRPMRSALVVTLDRRIEHWWWEKNTCNLNQWFKKNKLCSNIPDQVTSYRYGAQALKASIVSGPTTNEHSLPCSSWSAPVFASKKHKNLPDSYVLCFSRRSANKFPRGVLCRKMKWRFLEWNISETCILRRLYSDFWLLILCFEPIINVHTEHTIELI